MKVLHSYLTFAKRAFKKKLGFYLHFEKKSNLALKSGYPYDRMQSFRKKIIKHGKNGQNSYFS